MIFTAAALDGIVSGTVTLAFRRWERPRVRAGSSQRTAIGVVAFDAVEPVDAATVSDADAVAAGFESAERLLVFVDKKAHGPVLYRIALRFDGADPRLALREDDALSEADVADLRRRLDRLDAHGPWTEATLRLIADRPAVVSTELAPALGMERAPFKQRVRRLKELGLTESLEVGYRLSPRGRALLARLGT
ncbi:hypothetical protein [Rhodococcus tukisamuensis]|uniref:Uncharacterized protein n=1 Tax=Rhodococcus tukisamuensis TaxID=168276 RepID=A0A1G6VWE0_9NOCA|nr:hypothetical protein [Rhodococcus tukisamuensis]SDD57126.1 hypothetical protein SAMN05444580_105136 [Rhodococcus tukisamuensis]